MKSRQIAAYAALICLLPLSVDAAGRFGGGGGGGDRGGGGFDMHSEAPTGGTHSSTGPAGTSRTTTYGSSGDSAGRSTTATNGNYSKTTTAGASNGQYQKNSSASNGYASKSSSTSANSNTGAYSRSASGSNATGSYDTQTSGNTHTNTAEHTTNASNVYGQSYHGSTTANNGYVTHGAYGTSGYYGGAVYVANPVYGAYPVYGWNAGVAWYPAPIYYGGGFWGPYALGVATVAVWGTIAYQNQTITSYEVQADSPGAKLLASYKLTQTPCGPPDLVVILGPNSSAICAKPNTLVSAGTYNVDSKNLTIVSAAGAAAYAPPAAQALPAPASPLAALPVGASASYRIAAQTDAPAMSGKSNASNYVVRFARISAGVVAVQIDGSPSGQITIGQDGTPAIPSQIKKQLAPFSQVGLLMRGATNPLSPGAQWSVNVPIPLDGDTDIVPTTVSVSHISTAGATMLASGQGAAAVKPGLREKPATINLDSTMSYNSSRALTSANSKLVISVKAGIARTKTITSTWNLAYSGQ